MQKTAIIRNLLNSTMAFVEFLSIITIPILYIFLRPKISYPYGHDTPQSIKPGTLILSNHQAKLDPFFIVYYIGWKNLRHNLPIRFPIIDTFMKNPLTGIPLRLLGGYTIGNTPLESAKRLLLTRQFILNKSTVILFPEGKRVREGNQVCKFKKGMHMLINDKTPILLIHLKGMNTWSWFNFSSRHQVHIRFSPVLQKESANEKIKKIQDFFNKNDN